MIDFLISQLYNILLCCASLIVLAPFIGILILLDRWTDRQRNKVKAEEHEAALKQERQSI